MIGVACRTVAFWSSLSLNTCLFEQSEVVTADMHIPVAMVAPFLAGTAARGLGDTLVTGLLGGLLEVDLSLFYAKTSSSMFLIALLVNLRCLCMAVIVVSSS